MQMSMKVSTYNNIRRLSESCLQTAGKEQHQSICTRNRFIGKMTDFVKSVKFQNYLTFFSTN